MRISSISVVAVTLALAACSTPQQRAERAQAEMAEQMTVYGPACSRLGYAQNSDQWRQCVLQLSTREELRHAHSYYAGWSNYPWRGAGYWGPYW